MESPVVLDQPPEYHGIDDRGFPFEEEEGGGAWSELAARHPDIAARLRHHPAHWATKRRPDSGDAADFGDSFGDFDRLIPSEFREHFPSHFNRRFGREEHPSQAHTSQPHTPQPHTSHPHTSQPHTSQSPPKSGVTIATQTEHDPPEVPQSLPQYGLRNTVDLGQRSAVDPSLVDADDRTQRSMSAPPQTQSHNMSGPAREPSPHTESSEPRKVRNIPIFVEGRDAPVINDNLDHGFGEPKPAYVPPPAQDSTYFQEEPLHFNHPSNFKPFGTPFSKHHRQGQPFAQKMFPQNPPAFAHGQRSQSPKPQEFVNLPVHHENSAKQQQHKQPQPPQRQQPHQQQHPHQQQQPQQQPHQQPPQPKQQQHPQSQQQQPPKQPTPPPQPAPKQSNDPITRILEIQTNVLNLMAEVEKFTGTKKDKHYLYLDEMLTLNLLKLDNIETEGKENIRNARKEAIRCIQKCIAVLEAKADNNKSVSTPQPQDVDMNNEEAPGPTGEAATENGEVEMKETPKEEVKAEQSEVKEDQKPEVAPPADKDAQADTRTEESAPENAEAKGPKLVKNKSKGKANKEDKNEAVDDKGETKMDVDGAASQ